MNQNSIPGKNMVQQRNSSLHGGSRRAEYGSNYRVSQNVAKPKVLTIKVEDLDINKVIDEDKAI